MAEIADPARTLEAELCRYFGRKHCILTGRAASAIYVALKTIPAQGGKVILPAVLCPSPANVVLYAGFEPIFCDVNPRDFNLDPTSLKDLLDEHDDVVAVIPAHLYGFAADMGALERLARERDVFLIEDAAQAVGGEYQGRKLGSFGDVSVVSFGHTKTIDVGWGGAILTDDPELARKISALADALPDCPADIDRMYADYRKLYYSYQAEAERDPARNDLFMDLPKRFREMHLFRFDAKHAGEIQRRFAGLDELVRVRREHFAEYARRLIHPKIIQPSYPFPGAPWRFSFLVSDGSQKRVTEALRKAGLDASNWYPPLYRWYESGRQQDPRGFTHSDYVASHVVNLWVEPRITQDYIEKACRVVLEELGAHTTSN